MTIICSGGTSSPKPGIQTRIIVDQAFIQSILPPALAWLYPYLPFMHGLEIGDVPTFCSTDPPTWTVPSALDIYNFLVGGPITSVATVNQFLQDITKAYLWYNICQCDSVGTPAPPTPPAAPTGAPVINPPNIVTPQPTIACATAVPFGPSSFNGGNNAGISNPLNINGLNVTAARGTLNETNVGGRGFIGRLYMSWFNATALVRRDQSSIAMGPGLTTHIFPAPPGGAISGQLTCEGTGTSGTDHADCTTTLEYFCDGAQPGGYNSACCPPDPNLTAMLVRIDQLVTIMQRQISPFGSIDGTSHSGLTGHGHIDISEPMLGVRVTLTTIPASYGIADGDPQEHFDLGFVHLGDGDEWFGSRRLEQSTVIWQPRWCGMATRVGYTLSPGVVATIVELHREP